MSERTQYLPKPQRWRQVAQLLALLLLLLGTVGEGRHHHDDLREHKDCQVCVLGAPCAVALPTASLPRLVSLEASLPWPDLIDHVVRGPEQFQLARAPPA
jgi:hypothetical protein